MDKQLKQPINFQRKISYLTFDDPLELQFDKQFPNGEEINCCRSLLGLIRINTKIIIFHILSILCGVIFSFIWGFIMGNYQFIFVWFVTPIIQIIQKIHTPFTKVK